MYDWFCISRAALKLRESASVFRSGVKEDHTAPHLHVAPDCKYRSAEKPCGAGDLAACHLAGCKRQAGDKVAHLTEFFRGMVRSKARRSSVAKFV
jgi:hypothetical protein